MYNNKRDYTLNLSQISFRLLTALRLRLLPLEIINANSNNSMHRDDDDELPLSLTSQSLIANWKSTLNGEREIVSNENEVEIYNWIIDVCIKKKNENELKSERIENFVSILFC